MSDFIRISRETANLSGGEILAEKVKIRQSNHEYPQGHKLRPEDIQYLQQCGIHTVPIMEKLESRNTNPEKGHHEKKPERKEYLFEGVKKEQVYDDEEGCLKVDSPRMAELTTGLQDFSEKMLTAVLDGSGFQDEQISDNIDQLMEGIQKNPAALISLTHLKDVDHYTFMHSVNVATLSLVFATSLGVKPEAMKVLGTGAMLHDIGKMSVDQQVLNKPGKLTDEEFLEMKQHTRRGYEILQSRGMPKLITQIALTHHEKLSGAGYPLGLKEDKIPTLAKIVSIVDVYDALTADRVYKKAMHPSQAFNILEKMAGNEIDLRLYNAFLQMMGAYPISSMVLLKNGCLARVIAQNPKAPYYPIVEIIADRYGVTPKQARVVSTESAAEYVIENIYKG